MSENEKVELSAVETMAVLNWKKSKVYYWISSGKFETVERIDGQKILLTRSEIEKLKEKGNVSENSEKVETVEESLKSSEEVQENLVQNITKNYKTFQNDNISEKMQLFENSLNTIEQIQKNYNFSLKLLTDGQADYKSEYLEMKAEKKTVEERLKKSENNANIKNIIITILSLLLILSISLIFLVLNNFVQFEKFQNKNVEQTQGEVINNEINTFNN